MWPATDSDKEGRVVKRMKSYNKKKYIHISVYMVILDKRSVQAGRAFGKIHFLCLACCGSAGLLGRWYLVKSTRADRGLTGSALKGGLVSCAKNRRGVVDLSLKGKSETGGGGAPKTAGGSRGDFFLPRRFLFPIARPAVLASLIRLPLLPERKPVIVPNLDPALFHAAGR